MGLAAMGIEDSAGGRRLLLSVLCCSASPLLLLSQPSAAAEPCMCAAEAGTLKRLPCCTTSPTSRPPHSSAPQQRRGPPAQAPFVPFMTRCPLHAPGTSQTCSATARNTAAARPARSSAPPPMLATRRRSWSSPTGTALALTPSEDAGLAAAAGGWPQAGGSLSCRPAAAVACTRIEFLAGGSRRAVAAAAAACGVRQLELPPGSGFGRTRSRAAAAAAPSADRLRPPSIAGRRPRPGASPSSQPCLECRAQSTLRICTQHHILHKNRFEAE